MDSILLAMGQLSAAEKAQIMLALAEGSALAKAMVHDCLNIYDCLVGPVCVQFR